MLRDEGVAKQATSSLVEQATVEIQTGLESLGQVIKELQARLSPVLTPSDSVVPDGGSQPRPACGDLAHSLHRHADTVQDCRDQLVSILERLEV